MDADSLDRTCWIAGDRVTRPAWEHDSLALCLEQPRQMPSCSTRVSSTTL